MMDCYSWGMHGFGLMWIVPLLFLGALILFLVRGPARLSRDRSRAGQEETAGAILDRRYASGEITKEQYDQMKADIGEK